MTLGGTANDKGLGIISNNDGFVYSMGTYLDTVHFQSGTMGIDVPGNPQFNNTFIQKISDDGLLTWVTGFSGEGTSGVTGQDIELAPNGNIVMLAFYFGTVDVDPGLGEYFLTEISPFRNYCIIVLNPSGELVWAKNIINVGTYDEVKNIEVNPQGELFVAGHFYETVDFDPGMETLNVTSAGLADAFVQKLDATGNFLWVKTWGSSEYDKVTALCLDSEDNICLSGWFNGTVDFDPGSGVSELTAEAIFSFNEFLLQLTDNGTFKWVAQVSKNDNVFIRDITADQSNNITLIGDFYSTVDFDPESGLEELTALGASDVCIVRYSPYGHFIWARAVGGSNYDFPAGIATNSNGELFCCGSFSGTADFDPGEAVLELSSSDGKDDIFIFKLTAAGTLIWAEKTGGPGNNFDRCWDICTNTTGGIFFTGQFRDIGIFDPGAVQTEYQSNGYEDGYVAKWLDDPTYIADMDTGKHITISPNPTTDIVSLFPEKPFHQATIQLINTSGMIVLDLQNQSGSMLKIDLSAFPVGCYFIRITENQHQTTRRIIVN